MLFREIFTYKTKHSASSGINSRTTVVQFSKATTMKSALILTFVTVAWAAAVDKQSANIVQQFSDVYPDGKYEHSFKTDNGISVKEQGNLKELGKDNRTSEITGSFEYTGADNVKYSIKYIANEFGYQPEGDHLPKAPEIPIYIQRALKWIAAHSQKEDRSGNKP